MTISTEIIRKITIQATSQGVDQTTAGLKGLADAQGNVAAVSDVSAKRSLSAEAAYNRQTLSVVAGARSQADYEKAVKVATAAMNQGVITADEHAKRVGLLNDKYGQGSTVAKAFAQATSGVSGQLIALSAGAGPVGTFLSALGPWGLAAAVGIGALSAAFNYALEQADKAGERAIVLRQQTQVLDTTVSVVKTLNKAGVELGSTSDSMASSMDHLAVNLDQARLAQGALYEAVRKVDGGLADQLRTSRDFPQALNIISQAWVQAGASQTAFSKAALGKGGVIDGLIFGAIAAAGSVEGLQKKYGTLEGVTEKQIETLARLKIENAELAKQTDALQNNWYAAWVLEKQNKVLRTQYEITAAVVNGTKAVNDNAEAEDARAAAVDRVRKKYPGATSAVATSVNPIQAAAPSRARVNSDAQADIDYANQTAKAWESETQALGALNVQVLKSVGAFTDLAQALQSELNVENKRLAALGSAVTVQERYQARLKAITADLAGHELTDDDAGRARQAAGLDMQIQKTSALSGILGVAATVADQYRARLQQITKAQNESNAATPAQFDNAKRLAMAQADGTFQLQAQIDAQKVQTALIPKTTAEAETYSLIQTKTNEAINAGVPVSAMLTDSYRKLAEQMGQAKQDGELAVELDKAQFEAKTALLTPLEKEIALLQKKNGINPQTDEIANLKRTTDATKEAQSAAISFGQDFAHSMEAGKSFTDSLSSSLKNLSAKLTDKAIEQLLSGEWEKAAISAVSAVVTELGSLFTGNSAAAHADVIKSIDYVSQLQTRQIAATQDMATLNGQLIAFDKQANIERMNNDRDGGRERNALELTLSEERAKIINDFNTQAAAADQAAATARLQAQQAINARIQTAQDRLFNATNDNSSLEGQLAAFDRQAQSDLQAERDAGGQALIDLESAQAAERFNIVKKYNDAIVASTQQAAQQQLDAQTKAARSIVDYLSNLNTGSASTLSPQNRLDAAQSAYNVKLALAQGGNSDALGGITQDAENLRKAAQDFYASGAGYQAIFQQIKSQLLSLPAVATSTDPVVAAMRDNIVATQNVQVAVQADTTQVVAQFNVAINKFSDAVSYLAQAVNQLVTSNALLDAIRALNDTSKQQLTLLAGQLTSQTGTTFSPSNIAPQTISRNMLDALRAIVVNTYAISLNTGRSVDFQRNGQGTPGAIGVLAGGGWITGGIPNKDSVLLGSRTALGMPGEFVVSHDVAQANKSWLPKFNETGQLPFANDNLARPSFSAGGALAGAGDGAGIVAELRRNNTALLQLLSAIGAAMVNAETNTGTDVKDAIVGALKEHAEVVKAEGRQARNNPKAA